MQANTKNEDERFAEIKNNAEEIKKEIENIENLPLSQQELLLTTFTRDLDFSNPAVLKAYNKYRSDIKNGVPYKESIIDLKNFIPNKAVTKQTSLGLAVIAEGWDKPIIFPQVDGFKWIGFVDEPEKVTTDDLWGAGYGYTPKVKLGAVGYSNVKPEEIKGGCSKTKKELSSDYVRGIENFYQPVFNYLKENGIDLNKVGFAFAHSYCGVDEAARNIVEKNNLLGYGVTPTKYTQYIKGTEYPPNEEFPNGYTVADFPFATVLTRHPLSQIEDYADIYGKMVGKENALGVFGGREHAFLHDIRQALVGNGGAIAVPFDIMKEMYGYEIPGTMKVNVGTDKEKEVVTNASRYMLDRIDGNPNEQFKYAFKYFLPNTTSKQDLTFDAQKSIATIAYTKAQQQGLIDKIN